MSTETVKRCDVTGKIRDDVCTIQLQIVKVSGVNAVILDDEVDLCDEALTRLLKFVARGTTPPGGKGKE